MRIVIVGDGKVGYALTRELSKEGHDIVVIDTNPRVLDHVMESADVSTVIGNGAVLSVQREAGVGESDLMIAATSSDEVNILSCILARKLGCKNTIARVRNTDYAEQMDFLSEELRLSMTFSPEMLSAVELFRMLQYPTFLERDTFAHGKIELIEFGVRTESGLIGLRLERFEEIAKVRGLVCAVDRDGKSVIPSGSFQLAEDDKVTVATAAKDVPKLVRNLRMTTPRMHEVTIVGGSRIAFLLAEMLLESKVSVKIIELNHERCLLLAQLLPGAIIVEGDGTSSTLLKNECKLGCDALVALTGLDEENIITALFSKYIGVPKAIPKINSVDYAAMLSGRGIECYVSPKMLVAEDIMRFVRAMETTDNAILTLTRIAGGKVEATEFEVCTKFRGLNTPLAELAIRPQILVASINRGGQVIIPSGGDRLQNGDTVIVVAPIRETIISLNDILVPEVIPELETGAYL